MPNYLILIYGDERRWDGMSPDEIRQIDDGHRTFRAKAGSAILSSGQLESTSKATTLRAGSTGTAAVTDGPFLESKEVLGGFYLVEAADRDVVISYASTLAETAHDHGGVEIIPLVQSA
jgi:hypothetical protein